MKTLIYATATACIFSAPISASEPTQQQKQNAKQIQMEKSKLAELVAKEVNRDRDCYEPMVSDGTTPRPTVKE